MSITRINRFLAKPNAADQLKSFLQGLIPYIEASEGCESCALVQQDSLNSQFYVIEKWRTKADHQASVAGFPKENMMSVMALLAEAPQGNYYHPC